MTASGHVRRTYRVSGGRTDNLHPGSYHVFQRNRYATAYDDYAETMNYMVSFTRGVTSLIGFHDIPRESDGKPVQSTKQLGERLSAGCVRQATPDAKLLWNFAPIGTPVRVLA